MRERMSLGRQVTYCLGGPGFEITGAVVVSIGIYFYLPPEGIGLEPLLSEQIFFGFLTAYGLARMIGGLFDSLADPFVGHWSDRSRSRLGRRRVFLVAGIVPMCAAPALLFFPPGAPGSTETFLWLAALLALYYVFFTVYVGPYLALIPEIAPSETERVRLARLRALVAGPVTALFGPAWLAGLGIARDSGLGAADAVRLVVVVSCALAFVLCALPIFAVDEQRFARATPSTLPWSTALGTTLRDGAFLLYLAAQILMILGLMMVAPSLPYIARVLLERDEGFAALLGLAMIPGAAVGFATVHRVAVRLGAKRTLVASSAWLGVALLPLGAVWPAPPGSAADGLNLTLVVGAIAMAGVPLAGLLVMPIVIVGQLIDRDEAKTGAHRSAMYFGVQGLLTKWVYAAAGAVLSYLFSAWGRSPEQPLGVILVGPIGGLLCIASAALFLLYPEREVLRAAVDREGDGRADRHAVLEVATEPAGRGSAG